jgi:hypothetical protein
MARYGISYYGASFYGAPSVAAFSAEPFDAVPTGYGSVLLTWRTPGGTWDEIRLVRNIHGYPAAVDNGEVIYTAPVGGDAGEFSESDLARGRWVYYTIFAHDTTQDEWVRSGNARAYIPQDYLTGQRLYDLTPWVTQSDALARFLSVAGWGIDLTRNDVNTLLDLYDSRQVLYDMVPAAMAQLGIPEETELEPENYRRFLRNAMRFYKSKGTSECAHGVAAAVTGYQAQIGVGTNILWDAEYSDFAGGIGQWDAEEVNCTATWVAPNIMRLTSTGGEMSVGFVTTDTVALMALPTSPGEELSVLVTMGANGNTSLREARIDIDWYDLLGGLLSTTSGATTPMRSGISDSVLLEATAPANAIFFAPRIVVEATTAGEQFDVVQARVNRNPEPLPHQPGRDIRVTLLANRINYVANGSAENGLTGWTEFGNVDLTRDTTRSAGGDASFRLVYTDPTPVTGNVTPTDYVIYPVTTVPGRRYGVQVSMANDTPQVSPAYLKFHTRVTSDLGTLDALTDSDNATAQVSTTPSTSTEFSADLAHTFAFVADTTEVYLVIGFLGARQNDAINFDMVIVEQAPEGTSDDWYSRNTDVVRPYFDGSHTSITDDYFWEGDEYASPSHYYSRRTVHEARLRDVLPRYLPFGSTYTLLWAQPESPPYVSDDTVIAGDSVDAPVAAVGRDLSLRYRQRFTNASLLALRWNQISAVEGHRQMLWNDGANAVKTLSALWNILSAAGYGASSGAFTNGSSSYNIAIPASTVPGNFLVLTVTARTTSLVSTPAGWTYYSETGVSAGARPVKTYVFYRWAQAGDAGSNVLLTFGGNQNSVATIGRYTDIDTTFPIATSAHKASNGTTFTGATAYVHPSDALLVHTVGLLVSAGTDPGAVAFGGGVTSRRVDNYGPSDLGAAALGDEDIASSGVTTARTLTAANSSDFNGLVLALNSSGVTPLGATAYRDEVLADTPAALWMLGEGSGTQMTDASPNARHGTYATAAPPTAATLINSATSSLANAYAGGGRNGDLAYAAWMTASAISIEFWLQTSALGNVVTRLDPGSGVITWTVRVGPAGSLILDFYDSAGGTYSQTITDTVVNDGRRRHFAIVRRGTTVDCYTQGSLHRSVTAGNGVWTGVNGQGGLRVSDTSGHKTQAVAFWGSALTAAQIQRHFAAAMYS